MQRREAQRLLEQENKALQTALAALRDPSYGSLDEALDRVVAACAATTAAIRKNPNAFR